MKIVCDNCGAKYRIADEKAQGKTFKLRCKRCEDVIRVEGDDAAESQGGVGSGFGEDYGGDASVEWYAVIDGDRAGPITSDEVAAYVSEGVLDGDSYVWRSGLDDWEPLSQIDSLKHLVSDEGSAGDAAATDPAAESGYEQTRVMDPSQTGALTDDASDATETHQDGDWDKTTEEMPSDGRGGDAAAAEADLDELEPEETVQEVGDASSEHDGMFAGVSDPDDTATGNAGSNASQVSGVWSSSSGTFESFDEESTDSDGGASEQTARTAGPGVSDELVDQRNENSVLFSLDGVDEMNAVEEGSDDPEAAGAGATTEGSGLIDIQSLAATHAAMSSEKEEGGASKGAAAAAQASDSGQMNNMPNLAPSGSRGRNTGLIVAIVVGALILAAAGIAAVYVMTQGQEPQRVQRVAEAKEEGTSTAAGTGESTEAESEGASDGQAVAAAGEDAGMADAGSATASAGADAADEREESDDTEANKVAEAEQQREESDPQPSPEPEPTRTARRRESSGSGGGDDDLDELLGNVGKGSGGSGGSSGGGGETAAQQETEPAEDLPEKPSRSMVMDTIRKYSGRVNNCGQKSNKDKLSGTCKVKFTVEPSGQTSNVSVQSADFQGTDVGSCVRGVVQSMSFPKTQKGMPVLFPFKVN